MPVVNVEVDPTIGKVSRVTTTEVITDPESELAVQVSDDYPENATGLNYLDKHEDPTPEQEFGTPAADATPPVTTAVFTPSSPGDGGTYTVSVTVALDATDTGNSGIDVTEYRLGTTGPFVEYDEAIAYADAGANGDKTIQFRSVDNNGNVEATKTVTLTVNIGE